MAQPGPIFGWPPLETEDNGYALLVRNRADNDGGRSVWENGLRYLADIGRFVNHPAILSGLVLSLTILAVFVWLIWFRRDATGTTPWERSLMRGEPAALLCRSLVADRRWQVA